MLTRISFEFFPPNTPVGVEKLITACEVFKQYHPAYFSVTFGASGAARTKTFRTVRALHDKHYTVAPHLTCQGLSKETIRLIIQQYKNRGISRLVVIRGDISDTLNNQPTDFQYANELVHFIRQETGDYFDIYVAAYPEFHPQSADIHTALEQFKNKMDAGANGAITQYFFNTESYFRFLDNCRTLNIHNPIIPGIMSIYDFEKLMRFSKLCGADIPLWLYKRLDAYRHDEASLRAFGIDVITTLCHNLISGGAPGLHFYTLNQLEPTKTIVDNIMRGMVNKPRSLTSIFSDSYCT